MPLLYTRVTDRKDWTRLTTRRDLSRWYTDEDCTVRANEALADRAGDDIYTEGGWNVEPPRYPALVHVEA